MIYSRCFVKTDHRQERITAILPNGEVWVQPPKPVRGNKSVRPRIRFYPRGGEKSGGRGRGGGGGEGGSGSRNHRRDFDGGNGSRRAEGSRNEPREISPDQKKLLDASDPRFKSRVCRHWSRRMPCPYGDDCNFAHHNLEEESERKSTGRDGWDHGGGGGGRGHRSRR